MYEEKKHEEKIMRVLAGDIGGTNTRIAVFNDSKIVHEEKFKSRDFKTLEDIITLYLQKHPTSFDRACFGVAGPVVDEKCVATNLPWVVDLKNLKSMCKLPQVYLLNDLETKAWGINALKPEEFFMIQEGNSKAVGNRALIAAGTGLGEAGLYWDGKMHQPFACEGGHTDFGPRNDLEVELLQYLQKAYGHVSYERVVSGPGIYVLYQFLEKTGRIKPLESTKKLIAEKNPSQVISETALRKADPACSLTIDLFLSLYGAEAGNLALKFMALGGVYIGGGIAPHLMDLIKEGSFVPSFLGKGRFKPLLQTIPIYVILNDDASLLGANYFARSR